MSEDFSSLKSISGRHIRLWLIGESPSDLPAVAVQGYFGVSCAALQSGGCSTGGTADPSPRAEQEQGIVHGIAARGLTL